MHAQHPDVFLASASRQVPGLTTARRHGSPASAQLPRKSSFWSPPPATYRRTRADAEQDSRFSRARSVEPGVRRLSTNAGVPRCSTFDFAMDPRSGDVGELRESVSPRMTAARMSLTPSDLEGSCSNFVYGSPSVIGTKSFRILCYGDSNSIGFRGLRKTLLPYGKELAEMVGGAGFPCEVTCCGLCGLTSEDLVNEIHSPCIRPRRGPTGEGLAHILRDGGGFDLVIIMVGTNDIGHFMDARMTQAFVARLHGACHALGVPTVNIVPPTVSGMSDDIRYKGTLVKARDLRNRLAELMSTWARNCPQVLLSLDCEALVPKNVAQLWEPDEIHLSITGSKQLAKNLAAQLLLVLGQLKRQSPRGMQPVVQENLHRKPCSTPIGSIFAIPNLKAQSLEFATYVHRPVKTSYAIPGVEPSPKTVDNTDYSSQSVDIANLVQANTFVHRPAAASFVVPPSSVSVDVADRIQRPRKVTAPMGFYATCGRTSMRPSPRMVAVCF